MASADPKRRPPAGAAPALRPHSTATHAAPEWAGESFEQAVAAATQCTVCAAALPLGPRPVFRLSPSARLLIIGQAPGTKVHATGIPWNDPSGDRLREWLRMERAAFYDTSRIAILPMGMCYPGRLPRGGDAPPRPECAPLWHARLLRHLPDLRLTLLVGSYAVRHALPHKGPTSLAETVQRAEAFLPRLFPLPHPSWRTRAWAKRNSWFETETLPLLQRAVAAALAEPP